MVPSREAVSLSIAAPVKLSSKDLLGGSSWDGSVKGPHPGSPNETANSPVTLLTAAQRTSSFLEAQTGLGKEGSDQMRLVSQASDREVECLMQLFQVPADSVAQLHMLEVVPTPFVPGVQIRA